MNSTQDPGDVPFVTGRQATTLREWFAENRAMLIEAVDTPAPGIEARE